MVVLRIDFDPEAIEEARDAFLWYRHRNTSAGQSFAAEFERAIDVIRSNPERGPHYLDQTRRFLLRRYPYHIVYRFTENSVQVIAVAHSRRRPGYWRSRA
jgi:plasmid stabilization system protein ParE